MIDLNELNRLVAEDRAEREASQKKEEAGGAPESRGWISAVGSRLGRGTIQAISSVGEAAELADLTPREIDTNEGFLDKFGRGVMDWSEKMSQTAPLRRSKEELRGEHGLVKRGVLGGIESMPLSASVMAGTGLGVLAASWIPIPGARMVGGAIGGLTALVTQFGVGQYGQEYRDVYNELGETQPDLSEEERREKSHNVALGSAEFEVGTEIPEHLAALFTFGGSKFITTPAKLTLKTLLRATPTSIGKGIVKQMPFSVGSEMVAGGGQAWVRQKEGVSGPSISEGIKESIIPAITMAFGFGVGAAGLNVYQSHKAMNDLNSDDVNVRQETANLMAKRIAGNTRDEGLAMKWRMVAQDSISKGEKFDFEEKIVDFASIKLAEDVEDAQGAKPDKSPARKVLDETLDPEDKGKTAKEILTGESEGEENVYTEEELSETIGGESGEGEEDTSVHMEKGVTPPGMTFQEFAESQGITWPIGGKDERLPGLKAAFDEYKAVAPTGQAAGDVKRKTPDDKAESGKVAQGATGDFSESLIAEAKKYKTVEEFVQRTHEKFTRMQDTMTASDRKLAEEFYKADKEALYSQATLATPTPKPTVPRTTDGKPVNFSRYTEAQGYGQIKKDHPEYERLRQDFDAWRGSDMSEETPDAMMGKAAKFIEDRRAAKQRPKAEKTGKGPQNLLTDIIFEGGLKYGKDYGEWVVSKSGKKKNILLEDSPDIKRAQNESRGYDPDDMARMMREKGYRVEDGTALMELVRTGKAREYFAPGREDLLDKQMEGMTDEWIAGELAEIEAREVEGSLEEEIIGEIAQEENATDEEVESISGFFAEMREKSKTGPIPKPKEVLTPKGLEKTEYDQVTLEGEAEPIFQKKDEVKRTPEQQGALFTSLLGQEVGNIEKEEAEDPTEVEKKIVNAKRRLRDEKDETKKDVIEGELRALRQEAIEELDLPQAVAPPPIEQRKLSEEKFNLLAGKYGKAYARGYSAKVEGYSSQYPGDIRSKKDKAFFTDGWIAAAQAKEEAKTEEELKEESSETAKETEAKTAEEKGKGEGEKQPWEIKDKEEAKEYVRAKGYEAQNEYLSRLAKEKGITLTNPWDLQPSDQTLDEYVASVHKNTLENWVDGISDYKPKFATKEELRKIHKQGVEDAQAEGYSIRQEILADYPDLKSAEKIEGVQYYKDPEGNEVKYEDGEWYEQYIHPFKVKGTEDEYDSEVRWRKVTRTKQGKYDAMLQRGTLKAVEEAKPAVPTLEEYVYGDNQLSKLTPETWKEQFPNIPYQKEGTIKVYRGAFLKDRYEIKEGDWVTLDKKFAQENYAGEGGRVFEKEVPVSELMLNMGTSQPGKSELIWKPEVSLEAYGDNGKYIKLADKYKQLYPDLAKPAKGFQLEQGKVSLKDFGEKMPGARKDQLPSIQKDLADEDIASLPLSKIWPKAEVDAIEDIKDAAIATAFRAEIPAKPRTSYKVKGWVEQVKEFTRMTRELLSGERADEMLTGMEDNRRLAQVAAKIRLLEKIDRNHWSRIGRVREQKDAYRFDDNGEKIPSPYVVVEIDSRGQTFRVADIEAAIPEIQNMLEGQVAAKKMKFEVRGGTGKVSINKAGDSLYRALITFETSKEAFDYRNEHYDALVQAWEDLKNKENVTERDVRGEENRPRAGQDYRKDKDATPEMFTEAFGFRGVEFGNWVSQGKNAKERQGMLNQAYDALHDLANIIGIPPQAVSLNGSLGLAFGSRGAGWASAHYEPDTLVINLTKPRGAGCLAHEFFHALDHYFQRQRGEGEYSREGSYITYSPENYYQHKERPAQRLSVERFRELEKVSRLKPGEWEKVEGVRPEVAEAFTDLVKALNDSPMAKRSRLIDKGQSGYWSRIIERAARSFENYVIAKMQQEGYHNDYLANVVQVKGFARDVGRYPYLLEEELPPVSDAFDALFSTLKTRETEKGLQIYEPGVEYTHENVIKEQLDLFGNVPATGGTDLHPPAGVAGAIRAGALPEVVSVLHGYYKGGRKASTAADIARLGQINLTKYPNEHFLIVVTNKNNDIINILAHTTGMKTSSSADYGEIAGQALNTEGAVNVWLLHQHPSGNAKLSDEDKAVFNNLQNTLEGTDLTAKDIIATTYDKYSAKMDYVDRSVIPEGTQKEVKLRKVVREFKTVPDRGIKFDSEDSVRSFAKTHLPDGGIVLVDHRNAPVATLRPGDYGKLRGAVQTETLKMAEKRNATGLFVIEPDRAVNTGNVLSFAKAMQLNTIDIIDITGSELGRTGEDTWKAMRQNASPAFLRTGEATPAVTQHQAEELQAITKEIWKTLGRILPADAMRRLGLELRPFITMKGKDIALSVEQHGGTVDMDKILGSTSIDGIRALIEISYAFDQGTMGKTAFHEAFHVAARWTLPEKDYSAILNYYKGNEEKAAEAFAEAAVRWGDGGISHPDSAVKRAFVRLLRILQRLNNYLKGRGYMRPEDVFAKLYTGSYSRMQSQTTRARRSGVALSSYAPALYSQLLQTVRNKMTEMPAKAQSLVKWLQRQDVKPEEMKWMGVEAWIAENETDGRIDKQAFADFLEANRIELVEKWKGGPTEDEIDILLEDEAGEGFTRDEAREYLRNDETDITKFHTYTLPGGENYREMLVKLPEEGKTPHYLVIGALPEEFTTKKAAQAYIDKWNAIAEKQPEIKKQLDEYPLSIEEQLSNKEYGKDYHGAHWDEPNVLAHIRMNDRTDAEGNKILFLEEIQSDWLQEAKEKGMGEKPTVSLVDIGSRQRDIFKRFDDGEITREERNRQIDELDVLKAEYQGVPTAPFLNNWHEVLMKRALRMAAEGGYDKLSWTTGAQQAERYDLSKQIDELKLVPSENVAEKSDKKWSLQGYKGDSTLFAEFVNDKEIEKWVGKGVSGKLLAATPDKYGIKTLSGLDLKVGGEGMAKFYDELLPGFMRKYVKQWGARVSTSEIQTREAHPEVSFDEFLDAQPGQDADFESEEDARNEWMIAYGRDIPATVHSVTLTPEMKSSVLYGGQSMFAIGGWHGSPHSFDKFSTEKIGTGEGNQAFGWGLYFSDLEEIARSYAGDKKVDVVKVGDINIYHEWNSAPVELTEKWRKLYVRAKTTERSMAGGHTALAENNVKHLREYITEFRDGLNDVDYQNTRKVLKQLLTDLKKPQDIVVIHKPRNLYKVTLHKGKEPGEYEWLDWDKFITPAKKQSVLSQIKKEGMDSEAIAWNTSYKGEDRGLTGQNLYHQLSNIFGEQANKDKKGGMYATSGRRFNDKEASLFLLRADIDGIRYPSGTISGIKESDAKNYVVFDENAVTIEGAPQTMFSVAEALPSTVKKRMEAARGVPKTERFKGLKEWKEKAKHGFYHFPGLATIKNVKLRAQLKDILRLHQEVPETAKDMASRKIRDFLSTLKGKQDYEDFRTTLILADLVRDLNNGVLVPGAGAWKEEGPFGFKNGEEVRAAYAAYQQKVEASPNLKEALKKRQEFVRATTKELVKHKILKKEALQSDDYFHHQVLAHWGDTKGTGTSSKDVRKHWRGWMAARKGSILDYNTEYVEAEFSAVAQQLAQIDTAETMEALGDTANIIKGLKASAKAQNLKNFYEMQPNPLEDPLKPYKAKIAMAHTKLEKMAADGTLEYDSEWADLVEALALSHEMRKDKTTESEDLTINDTRWFPFLSYLIDKGKPGASWAATIYKAIHDRNKEIETTLGEEFLTYRDIMPEGYTEWMPDPKKGWFWANTVADNVIQDVIAGTRDLKDKEVRKVLAKGQNTVWVIPEGLAATLDNFRGERGEDTFLGSIARKSMSFWKQYILINPFSVLKYNVNNMSGDTDICIAYAPSILKHAAQATKDMVAWHRQKVDPGKLREEMAEARKLGVIGSGFSVQEVEDVLQIMSMDKFIRNIVAGEKLNLIQKYWKTAQQGTACRENILRLAAFRWFKGQIAAGKKVYGASFPQDVDAITDPTKKAAKLARELLGDYGNLSKHGEYLRARMIPFYSWLEINAPRYVYMLRNLKHENGESEALKGVSLVAVKKTAMFMFKASLLFTMVSLFNRLVWPDEEEAMGEAGRRQLHLILGRREDGSVISIRFQGALSDALSFFGAEDLPSDYKDVTEGKSTIQEKMLEIPKGLATRVIQGIRPDIKMFGEVLTGSSIYPDPFSPRPIRDTLEHVLKTFKLDIPYKYVAGKPQRGSGWMEHMGADLKKMLVYESDPGEQAYYDTRNLVFDWQEKQGKERSYGKPTKKGNALYYYRQALKYGDLKASEKYLKKYYDLGGKVKTLRQSLKNAHPLTGIPKRERYAFRQSLSKTDDAIIMQGIGWYKKTYQ